MLIRQMFSRGTALSIVIFASMGLGLSAVPQAYAQDGPPDPSRQFTSKTGAIVNEALQFINASQYQAALGKLSESLAIPELTPYEKSVIYQMQGQAYYELNQIAPAVTSFENSISSGGLLPNESENLRVNIAQLLIADGQYARGAQMLEDWNRRGGQLKTNHVEMLTQAWVQSDNFSRALPWAERWFNEASPKERRHFDLLNYLYNTTNQPGKQADIVRQMINRWPEDKTLWDAWASMLANGGREDEAFEVNKMLYLGGALNTEADLLKVVQYYSFYDMPFQAAEILQREMNAGRINESPDKLVQLSDLYRQAREYKRAIPILERAASSAGTGKLFAQLGEALYNEGQCAKAEDAFTNAINRGYEADKAWMLIGTCRYEDSQKEERLTCDGTTTESRRDSEKNKKRRKAIEAFSNVPRGSKESRNSTRWVSFIRAETKAVEDRCIFEAGVERDLCEIKIKQAYDAEVFKGAFELDDPNCLQYKAAYDAVYRVRVNEDG